MWSLPLLPNPLFMQITYLYTAFDVHHSMHCRGSMSITMHSILLSETATPTWVTYARLNAFCNLSVKQHVETTAEHCFRNPVQALFDKFWSRIHSPIKNLPTLIVNPLEDTEANLSNGIKSLTNLEEQHVQIP